MNRFAFALRLFIVTSFIFTSCSLPAPQNTSTPPASATLISPTSESQPTSSSAQPQAEHLIAIRQVDGAGEFYNKQTDEKFTPRGTNYVYVPIGDAHTILLFKVGLYDPQRTRVDFSQLAGLGYNTVRFFLDQCNKGAGCIGDDDNIGLNPAYLDNIADMMLAARASRIFIVFTSNDLPDQGGYSEEANAASGATFAGYRNSYYLTPQAITATRRYWRDLLTGLVERNAAFDAVLAWELLNEQWMFRDQAPLSLTAGLVETTTGSYDMGDPNQKTQMVSDGLVYYISQLKEEILQHDPTALVTMGFFVPEIAAPDWYVETASLVQKSDLDFFDFHGYPGGATIQKHAELFGMVGYDDKPIVLGEYGAFHHIYAEADSAARALTQWVADSCQYGFDGWLYWAYYPSDPSTGDQTWGLVDEDNYLLNLLAPANHPDPCAAVEIANDNLAYDKPVTASRRVPENPPTNAVDDNADTAWIAGDGPVQWLEVDLQGTFRITEIRLLVSQYPAGNTTHRVQVRPSSGAAYQTVYEFQGSTNDNDWLVFKPQVPLESVGQIRIQTIASPSWVAWREIQVYGEAAQP